jgi:hypothetical protein
MWRILVFIALFAGPAQAPTIDDFVIEQAIDMAENAMNHMVLYDWELIRMYRLMGW